MTDDPAIRARALSKQFGNLRAVDGIDLDIPAGRIYGFLGPNGSGKSTTIRLLCGLLKPGGGEVSVLGFAIPAAANALRQHIGYMTQRFSLYEDLTVSENLGFMASVYGLRRRQAATRIAANVALYRLEALWRQRAGTLSGGQKQRLALAGVTLHDPRLLLLDEPTSAVDPQSRREFWDSLFELAEGGTTILVSTHFMDEAERCHRLAILDRGRLVAEGEPRTLAAGIDAIVLEVVGGAPRRIRDVLGHCDYVRSVTQLGNRLRVTVAKETERPADRILAALEQGGLVAEVARTHANLEDVFVAATRPQAAA